MTDKPKVKLNGWFIWNNRLYGRAPDHPREELREGILCTSSLVSIETKNTIYELGDKKLIDDRLGPTHMLVKE